MKDDRRLLRLVIVVLAVVGTATTPGRTDAYGYDVRSSAPVSVLAPSGPEGSPVQPSVTWEQPISPSVEARGTSTTPAVLGNATNTVDDLAGAVSRPAGVADDFVSEVANNGKGAVWRAPGSTGNGGTVRVMEPTAQYPNGYVRFYNEGGQPLGLNGKPGPNSATHIPINPDGTYPLPKGWGGAG